MGVLDTLSRHFLFGSEVRNTSLYYYYVYFAENSILLSILATKVYFDDYK